MWLSFWRSRDRFSLDELRRLTEQLQKVQIVNEVNKDFVIEALRSIAELITYGDQHDSSFFDYFMEKQVMGEFIRILNKSRTVVVSLQLLQTMSIMIQNLKTEHAIYYLFSNEHINFLITYAFDFRNEELLSYYISFLRAISGKLNRNTISLLVKTCNEEVISFPLYVEAIRFAFHEENMIRTAVRALTLNVYHVGDEFVNRFITKAPHAQYFSDLVTFFQKQCINLNALVSENLTNSDFDASGSILVAVDEIEDNLYYFSDAISAGISDIGRLLTDNILQLLILPLLLPSLWLDAANEHIGVITSLYLLCCILHIVKIKDLANTIAATLFCPPEAFPPSSEVKANGYVSNHATMHECQLLANAEASDANDHVKVMVSRVSSQVQPEDINMPVKGSSSHSVLRDELLSYVISGNDQQVLGSLNVLATLLQTKELDETMLDVLGILPRRKQHKKLLLQALVGESAGEDQLFSPESIELYGYLQKLKDQYGLACSSLEKGNPHLNRFQVIDALVSLFCRTNISAETLWDGGWLLRQLLPYSEAEFNSQHLELIKDRYKKCANALLEEVRGIWPDLLISVLCDEWKKCKGAIEASSLRKEPKCILLPLQKSTTDAILAESSYSAAVRIYELVKVFVLLCQVQVFSLGGSLPEQPPINPPLDVYENCRAMNAGLNASSPKPGAELRLVDAVPCRISFERGKERHFFFLAFCMGTSGLILLAEELPLKQNYGVVRVAAPLAGSDPKIDDKHPRWLHLRIRPSSLPDLDTAKPAHGKTKTKAMVDGRWTLAFRDEGSCRSVLSMIIEEINLLRNETERRLEPLFEGVKSILNTSQNIRDEVTHPSRTSLHLSDASPSSQTPLSLS